jgi:hypothetical protein
MPAMIIKFQHNFSIIVRVSANENIQRKTIFWVSFRELLQCVSILLKDL